MVAYNLMLSVFPFVLLVLFVFSQVLRIEGLEDDVLRDLQQLFPETEEDTLANFLRQLRNNSTTIGVVAFIAALWIGASFWGAMDTAFCRIYHVECRGWVEQKRFAFLMLIVVVAFLAASVVLPAAEGALIDRTNDLPLGLSTIRLIVNIAVILGTLALTFLVCLLIYWAVPKGHMPWRAVWPGALFVTLTMGVANWLFPFYLTNVSGLSRFGASLGFMLIALVWFYAISLALLAGAVINSLRHEKHDTGSLPYVNEQA
jgi:YihY family inner membrane protein